MKKMIPAILGIVIAGLLLYAVKNKTDQEMRQNGSVISTASTQKGTKLKEYTDPAGFSFKYNEDISIEKQDDATAYANLLLASPDTQGTITIVAVDEPSDTIDSYLKKKNVGNAQKVTLAELDAREYKTADQIVTVALDAGVLFTITADHEGNKEYWINVTKTIQSSFAFKPPEKPVLQPPSEDSSAGDVEYDGEETIE